MKHTNDIAETLRPLPQVISYTVKEDGFLLTPCPNGKKTLIKALPIKVGSVICERCKHFVSIDYIDKVVKCNYINDNAQSPITLEQAKALRYNDVIYSTELRDSNGYACKFRVNGKVKTWALAKNAHRVSVPLKYGLYVYTHLTQDNLHEYSINDCK